MNSPALKHSSLTPVDAAIGLFIAVLWGFNYVAIKISVIHFPPIYVSGLRFTLVAAILIWFTKPPIGNFVSVFLISVVLGTVHFIFVFTSLTGVDPSVSSIILQLGTPFSALMAWAMLNDTFGWRRAIGMLIAFGGVVIIAGEPSVSSSLFHVGLCLGAAVCWGCANILIKKLEGVGPIQLAAWMALFAAPQLFVVSALMEEGQWATTKSAGMIEWVSVAYMAIGASIFAYGLWYHLMNKYEVSSIVGINLMPPVFAALSSAWLLGEVMTWEKIVGGLVTLFGVAVIQIRWNRVAGPVE